MQLGTHELLLTGASLAALIGSAASTYIALAVRAERAELRREIAEIKAWLLERLSGYVQTSTCVLNHAGCKNSMRREFNAHQERVTRLEDEIDRALGGGS